MKVRSDELSAIDSALDLLTPLADKQGGALLATSLLQIESKGEN